jgi:hypothetical protein
MRRMDNLTGVPQLAFDALPDSFCFGPGTLATDLNQEQQRADVFRLASDSFMAHYLFRWTHIAAFQSGGV